MTMAGKGAAVSQTLRVNLGPAQEAAKAASCGGRGYECVC
jgi:hypothetical protein